MTNCQSQLKKQAVLIDRIEKRLAYITRKQTHIHSRMDLIEENVTQLKLYLDTLSVLPAKYFDVQEQIHDILSEVRELKKGP